MRTHPTSHKLRWLLCLLGAGVAAAVASGVWKSWSPSKRPTPRSSAEQTFPLPPYSESRYLNTGPNAQYVGTAVCASSHGSKHDSYLLTAHSRSLAELDLNAEPPDGSFAHEKSGRSYRVYRQDGQLRHEEVLRTTEGKEIARRDLPVRYVVGSGNFSRSYLVEVKGFLFESPITWYASKKASDNKKPGEWGMSPGYDTPTHSGFERVISLSCLACHIGRAESTETGHGPTIRELAIGCESCHGRGSLHVALQKAAKAEPGVEDLTIVNPRKLSRPLLESLCGNCHLNGPARVNLRGRQDDDYRPGMPVTDYHIDYRFNGGNDQMTVVGHLEQLRRSPCYQKSKDLSCLTCHDPHAKEKSKDPTEQSRKKCLECHTTESCKKLDHAQRVKNDGTDNCVACHMPRRPTDIPHIAFTHHRIGKHPEKQNSPDSKLVPELVPTDDNSSLTDLDRKRNLGLAYFLAARSNEYAQYSNVFASRSRQLLEAVDTAGLHDAHTVEGLADLNQNTDPALCERQCREVLEMKDADPMMRSLALGFLAHREAVDQQNPRAAIELLNKLVRVRQYSNDWTVLGKCYLLANRPWDALSALETGRALRPDSYAIHVLLAEAYRHPLVKDNQRATEHKEKTDWLRQHGAP